MVQKFPREIIKKIEGLLNIKVVKIDIPSQGMDSVVVFIVDDQNLEYAIKYGKNVVNEALAYKLLKDNKIAIPTPIVFGSFEFNEKNVLILEKIKYPLLETISVDKMSEYVPSMLAALNKIHKVKSDKAGLLFNNNEANDWKTILLSKFNGNCENLDWSRITARVSLNKELILHSVAKIIKKIETLEFINKSYSLLHTDFNQKNLFVNPKTNDVAGIIDWGEALFGDPIYDFARVRMYIWHFNLSEDVLRKYYGLLLYTAYEKKLEKLYWLAIVIEYLAYYSEKLTEFNVKRIKLHQKFLKTYDWNN